MLCTLLVVPFDSLEVEEVMETRLPDEVDACPSALSDGACEEEFSEEEGGRRRSGMAEAELSPSTDLRYLSNVPDDREGVSREKVNGCWLRPRVAIRFYMQMEGGVGIRRKR